MSRSPQDAAQRGLLGRAGELRAIDRAIEAVAGDGGRGLAFVGEAGIGKTALLRAAIDAGRRAGMTVVEGGGTEFEREVPFGVVVEAFDALLGEQDSRWLAELGADELGELASVFPSLAGLGAGASTGLQTERFRFHHVVHSALERLAARQPLVIVLDDLHWADRSSLEILAHVLRRGVPARTLLLLAYRPRQASDLLLSSVAGGARDGSVTALEPAALSEHDAAELVGHDLDPDVRRALYRESGGNPFYLLELARAGLMPRTPRSPATVTPRRPDAVVSPSLHMAIAAELSAASADARRLLEAAAVTGEPFDLELAARVAELDDPLAFAALDELEALALVRATDVPGRYAFRHPIVRRALYESSAPGLTVAAHQRAASVLAERGAPLVARAHHVAQAAVVGDHAAIDLLVAAADATALRAPATAARWLSRALDLLPADAPLERRVELVIRFATALGTSGRPDESRAALVQVVPLLPPDQIVLKARLVGAIARLDHMLGTHGDAREHLAQALVEIGSKPSAGSTAVRVELAMDYWFADDWQATVRSAQAARVDAEATEDRLSYATATALETVGRGYLGELDVARALADEATATVDALPDAELAARLEALVVLSHAEFGGIERAASSANHSERGVAIARATGQEAWFGLLITHQCVAQIVLGRLAAASEAADTAIEAARLQPSQLLTWSLTLRCWIDTLMGDLPSAMRHGEEAIATAGDRDTTMFNWLAYCVLALALLDAGQPARARDMILEHAGGPDLRIVDRGWLPHWYENLTLAEIAIGDLDAAQGWADRAQAAAESFATPGRLAEAANARANLALALGRSAEAATLAQQAAEGFAAADWPIDTARAQIVAGRAFAALGDRERAIDQLRGAHARLASCGALGYRDEAARELSHLGQRASRVGPASGAGAETGPDALSPREREVAQLVARGLTNREIAETLFLGLKTVETHVSRILKKLGAPSRAAVAARIEHWDDERLSQ